MLYNLFSPSFHHFHHFSTFPDPDIDSGLRFFDIYAASLKVIPHLFTLRRHHGQRGRRALIAAYIERHFPLRRGIVQESGRGVLGEKHDSKRFESCMCAAGFGYKIAVVFAAWGTKICSRELGQYSRQRPNVFRYNAAAIDYKMRYQLAWRNIAAQYGNIFDTI